MGRLKRGLDYFPMSTNFIADRMVRRVMKHEGDSAFAVLVELLSYIYAGEGYYIRTDNEFYDELLDGLYSVELEDVKRIVQLAVKYGIFDSGLYHQHNILTSADIQRQYLFATKRRSASMISPAYCLLEEEELASFHAPKSVKGKTAASETVSAATSADAVTLKPEKLTPNTHNKEEQNKEKQNITKESKRNNLPNPPQGGNGGGEIRRNKRTFTQEDIDSMQAPDDGVKRNLWGLLENLRAYKISPVEQYAIILRSNYGAIGSDVWKGIGTIRGSNGKIKLPGHYLLSVLN